MSHIATRMGELLEHRRTGVPWLLAEERNLHPNPSAELDATSGGVTGSNATITRTTTVANVGSAAYRLSSVAATNMSVRHLNQRFAVTAGMAYSAAAQFRADATPRNCRVYIDWYNSSGVRISFTAGSDVLNTTTGWTRAIVENRIAPTGAVTAQVIAEVAATGAASEVHYVDAIVANEGATVYDYFDGDTASTETELYTWVGAAHASASLHRTIDPEGENDLILDAIIGALADGMERLGLVGYGDPEADIDGSRMLRDTRVAPLWALAHAALYVGATLPGRLQGESEESYLARARDAAAYPFGIRRGTHEAVMRAVRPYLTGSRTVFIADVDPADPYRIFIRTRTVETPDPAAVRRALEGDWVSSGVPGAIRAELILQYAASDFVSWGEATRTWDAVNPTVTWENAMREDVT